jgi:microcystin-dependent protein
MASPFIGQIAQFGGNFAPLGWAFCDGSLQSIDQNTALFSLLGTTYGGDGQTTFALPDLRGRIPIGIGQGPGLSNYVIGEYGGTESVTLTAAQAPAHTHSLQASSTSPNSASTVTPGSSVVLAAGGQAVAPYAGSASSPAPLAQTTGASVGGQPHNNIMPTMYCNYIIALEGIYPSRN